MCNIEVRRAAIEFEQSLFELPIFYFCTCFTSIYLDKMFNMEYITFRATFLLTQNILIVRVVHIYLGFSLVEGGHGHAKGNVSFVRSPRMLFIKRKFTR